MIKITEEILEVILSILTLVLGTNEVNYIEPISYEEKELMTLYIEKINVNNKIYDKNSLLNDIDINIMLLRESDYPDEDKGTVLLGGHSGVGTKAYLKRMDEMSIGDEIKLYYKDKEYVYVVDNISKDNKDGKIRVDYGLKDYNRLIIYTCYPNDKTSYLVLSANMIFT